MTFRNAVKALSPGPLQEGVGERYMYVFGFCVDALMQKMTEAGLARMPTRCDPSCLPVIGSDRLIQQGLTESVDSYRTRLQKAFESWQLAGSARAVLGQVLGYLLALTPMVRSVSTRYTGNVADLLFVLDATNETPIVVKVSRPNALKTGDTVTISGVLGNTATNTTAPVTILTPTTFELDGTTGNGAYTSGGFVSSSVFPTVYPPDPLSSQWDTYEAGQDPGTAPIHVYNDVTGSLGANWDWDGLSQVTGSWGWWGAFVVIFSVAPNMTFHKAPKWGTGVKWGAGSAWGVTESARVGRSIRAIVGQWKPAQAWVRWIIVSFDVTLFDPAEPAGGGINPDGYFGRWSKITGGQYVASRFSEARYGDGIA